MGPQFSTSASLALSICSWVGKLDRLDQLGVGQVRRDLLADLAGLQERGVPGRDRAALEVPERTLVGQDVLHPQLAGVGVRRVLHDTLRVVRPIDPVGRDHDLGGDARLVKLGLEARPVVGPVQNDRRLAGQDRGRGDVARDEVARLLEIGEELDAGHDVVEAAAIGEGGRHHAREGRAGLPRIVVEEDLTLVVRLRQVGDGLRRVVHDGRVGADGDDPVVRTDPVAVGILQSVRDLVPSAGLDTAPRDPRRWPGWRTEDRRRWSRACPPDPPGS